jgi:hypothetical protein
MASELAHAVVVEAARCTEASCDDEEGRGQITLEQLAQGDVDVRRVAVVERDANVVSPSQDVQYRAERVDRNPESVLAGLERPPGLADTVKTNAVDSARSDVELCALLVQRPGEPSRSA